MKVALIIAVLLLPAIVLAETCEKGMLVVQREEREISTSAKNCTCPSGYYCLQCADGNSGCFSTRHGQCCGCDSAYVVNNIVPAVFLEKFAHTH